MAPKRHCEPEDDRKKMCETARRLLGPSVRVAGEIGDRFAADMAAHFGPTPRTPVCRHACLKHSWELEKSPQESLITGVHLDFRYSVYCPSCGERTTILASEVCPHCFTTPESKRVDTEVSRFKHHPDNNLDPLHYATVHTCPTCNFKCVSFTYDK